MTNNVKCASSNAGMTEKHIMNHCILPFCCIATDLADLARITILIVPFSWVHVDAMCVAYEQVSALHISLPAPTTPCATWMCRFSAILNCVQYAFKSLWLWHPHNGDGPITNVPGMVIWGDGVCGLGLKQRFHTTASQFACIRWGFNESWYGGDFVLSFVTWFHVYFRTSLVLLNYG